MADLFKNTLSKIPTVYGRLLYLATLRTPSTGAYIHHGMEQIFGKQESQRCMREAHELVFAEWLRLPLTDKRVEMVRFLQTTEGNPLEVLAHWKTRTKVAFAPAAARPSELELFVGEIELIAATITALDASRDQV